MKENTTKKSGLLERSNNPSSADEATAMQQANRIMDTIGGDSGVHEEAADVEVVEESNAAHETATGESTAATDQGTNENPEETTYTAVAGDTDTDSAQTDAQSAEASRKTADRVYGCAVKPVNLMFTEAMIAEAWKESTNVYSKRREIHLVAQAVDPKTKENVGKSVKFSIIPNDLSHGSVPGRTICFTGYLTRNVNTPNHENGGLYPHDSRGWSDGDVWISIVFDLYDQIGEVSYYANKDKSYTLSNTGRSTALNPNAMPPLRF